MVPLCVFKINKNIILKTKMLTYNLQFDILCDVDFKSTKKGGEK